MTRPDQPIRWTDAFERVVVRCGCGAELSPAEAFFGVCASCRDSLVVERPERRERMVLS